MGVCSSCAHRAIFSIITAILLTKALLFALRHEKHHGLQLSCTGKLHQGTLHESSCAVQVLTGMFSRTTGQIDDRWQAFMKFQIARARQYFADAEAGVDHLDTDARWPVWSALILYRYHPCAPSVTPGKCYTGVSVLETMLLLGRVIVSREAAWLGWHFVFCTVL